MALGAYTEQESKKDDQWRDQTLGQLYNHLAHEVLAELKANMTRKDNLTWAIHNAMDAVGLSCIFLAKLLEMNGIL